MNKIAESGCDHEGSQVEKKKWVLDSSVDHKGKIPLRSSTGAWKASFFIIAIEFVERLTYFGISTNLITYLTKVMNQDLEVAAKNVNFWAGVTTVVPLLGGFLADAYAGRFLTIFLSSLIYLMGLSLLTMSEFVPSFKPCNAGKCTHSSQSHQVTFFIAIYLLSLGTGGHKPCLESFGADQFDDGYSEERKQRMSFFNWWNFVLCGALLLGSTVIVYIQDNAGWGLADIILTVSMCMAITIFYLGKPVYRYRLPNGSPLTPMLQVIVAAFHNRNLPLPSNPDSLYEAPESEGSSQRIFICHTDKLRFLDKAAVIEGNKASLENGKPDPWRIATVTRVEETKLTLNVIPIWLTSLIFGVCMAQATTFFIKQSSTMNRKIGRSFEIPPASISTVGAFAMLVCVTLYEKILIPAMRRINGTERGITILQRIGIGMVISATSMVVAALVEMRRLRVAKEEGMVRGSRPGQISMSVFWLAPQLVILSMADCFTLVGLQEYFYTQVPDSMRSLGIALFLSVIGVGNFLSSILISIVDHVTTRAGKGWFGRDLNESRFDYFCWLLAALSVLNCGLFVCLARKHSYKEVEKSVVLTEDLESA